jgi:hypothetical protein
MTLTAKKIIETALEVLDQEPQMMHGCYENLENETYHAIKSHISRSMLMDFMRSPYHYFWNHEVKEKVQREETDAMIFGSAFHTIVLEWLEFNNRYAVEPTKVLLKDVGREKYDEYKAQCEELEKTNKIILTADTYKKLHDMKVSLYHNDKISNLLIGGVNESSYFWKDEHSGFLLKCRPDILHENMIIDLKTCADASPRGFQSSMIAGGYHIQGAMIRDGVREITGRDIPNFICIAIEKTYPYATGIYMIDEFALEVGQQKYKQALLDLKAAKESNSFTDYGIQTIGLPKWAT